MAEKAWAGILIVVLLGSLLACAPATPPGPRTEPKAGEIATEVPPIAQPHVRIALPIPAPAMNESVPDAPPPPPNATRASPSPPNISIDALLPPAPQAQGLVEYYVSLGGKVYHDNVLEGKLRIYGEGNTTASVKVAFVGTGKVRLEVDGEPWPILETGEEHVERGVFIRVQRILSRN